MSRIWIPKVSLEVIHARSLRIKPLVRCSNHDLYFVRKKDIFKQSYIWNPEMLRKVKINQLVEITKISTYHPFDSHNTFIPTVAAVFAQIPEEHLLNTVGFEIIPGSFQMNGYNPDKVAAYIDGYHTGETILYARR